MANSCPESRGQLVSQQSINSRCLNLILSSFIFTEVFSDRHVGEYRGANHRTGRSRQLDRSEEHHASAITECQLVDKTSSVLVNPHVLLDLSALLLTDNSLTRSASLWMQLNAFLWMRPAAFGLIHIYCLFCLHYC
eukprot:TRINITY_DN5748_c0_g3_i1.p1 TRINITY_DN5748_c0_g3~~TRINITY_DN5748_c0_g3_i1.p1  ORF type:complete len:136 (+),score=3.53 TRINITY_DN5748_c0_g3_i1:33-440(+)